MISATDLKNGKTFLMDGKPYKVIKYAHQKIGRGGANVKLSVRNLDSGRLEEKTINSAHKVDEVSTNKRQLQYLYQDKETATFMDPVTFDQIDIPTSVVGQQLLFIKEGESVNVLFWTKESEEKPLSVEIAPKVTLKITETDPGVKGNSATNIFKAAVLENGLTTKVPLFINKGDEVKIDTETGEYIERLSRNS